MTAAQPANPRPKGPRTLGLVAFIVAVIAVLAGTLITYAAMYSVGGIGHYVDIAQLVKTGKSIDASSAPAGARRIVAAANDWALIGFAAWAILGVWAVIQGIVAIVRRRGRAWGVAAVIIAPVGYVIVQVGYYFGIAAGLAPYLSTR
jgi:hypothetical protein